MRCVFLNLLSSLVLSQSLFLCRCFFPTVTLIESHVHTPQRHRHQHTHRPPLFFDLAIPRALLLPATHMMRRNSDTSCLSGGQCLHAERSLQISDAQISLSLPRARTCPSLPCLVLHTPYAVPSTHCTPHAARGGRGGPCVSHHLGQADQGKDCSERKENCGKEEGAQRVP